MNCLLSTAAVKHNIIPVLLLLFIHGREIIQKLPLATHRTLARGQLRGPICISTDTLDVGGLDFEGRFGKFVHPPSRSLSSYVTCWLVRHRFLVFHYRRKLGSGGGVRGGGCGETSNKSTSVNDSRERFNHNNCCRCESVVGGNRKYREESWA